MQFLIVVILATFAISATGEDQKMEISGMSAELLKEVATRCITELGLSAEIREKLRNYESFDDIPNGKEYLFCVFRGLDWVDDNGKPSSTLQKIFDNLESKIKAAAGKCLQIENTNRYDAVFEIYKCYVKIIPDPTKSTTIEI